VSAPTGFRGVFRTDDDARAVYSEAAGIGRIIPRAVAVPINADDLSDLVQWASANGVPLIARGSGSSMAGGAIGDGVVVDLSRLRELDAPSAEGRAIRAESGVIRGDVDRAAATAGLRFPVDPSSGEFCTIGGMAATNAAGPHSVRHGSMRSWVLALDCVFADGSRGTIRRGSPPPFEIPAIRRFVQQVQPDLLAPGPTSHATVLKDSSGYALAAFRNSHELVDLLVGSEGTLALFTAVEVALIPRAGATASVFAAFSDIGHAVAAAIACRKAGASACELLDRTFLTIAARAGKPLPAPSDTEAALLTEVEGADATSAFESAKQVRELCSALHATTVNVGLGPADEADLWALRHAASPAIAKLDPAYRSMQFIEDCAVPPEALGAYVIGVRAILDRHDTPGVIFGHAGDAHVHVNPLIDTRRADWRERVERILVEVTDLVSRLDGTLTGEHGDGRLRTPLMDRTWTAGERNAFAAIKRAFDPQGILNPGVKVPIAGQRAIDAVKYDSSLSSLPDRAAAALLTVERERAYSRHRLDFLR
jgi:FAD/FMN-containing dehydrogenase